MDTRSRLQANLSAESEAYGYSLAVWGSGALLIDAVGLPDVLGTLGYLTGALLGFTALALLSWGGVDEKMTVTDETTPLVVSTMHILATGGSVLSAQLLILLMESAPLPVLFFLVGATVTVVYNCSLLVEESLGRLLT